MSKTWKYVHKEPFHYYAEILDGRYFDGEWLSITYGLITINGYYVCHGNGYAWDGCTPKWNFLQITWGMFDGKVKRFGKGDYKPMTYYASMVHDCLCQFKREAPVTRKEADLIFYQMLKDAGFMWAWLYYVGVRAFGWVFMGWKYQH